MGVIEMYKKTHIGSYGIIIKDGKIVLIKKAKGAYADKLDLPGGTIEHDETPDMAVKREILEEVGVKATSVHLFDAISCNLTWYCDKKQEDEALHHIGIIYDVKVDNYSLKKDKDGHDSLGAAWYNIDKLTENMVSPLTWQCLLKIKGDIND